MSNEITTIDRSKDLEEKNRYMTPRKVRIYTQTSFDNSMPGIIGLSIFIEAENNGNKYTVGKTKAIEDKVLPRIRMHLDKFGQEFTTSSMKNTSEASFKSLLSQILDNVIDSSNVED